MPVACRKTTVKEYEECLSQQELKKIISLLADQELSFKCIDSNYKTMTELGFRTTYPEDTITQLRDNATTPAVFYPKEKKIVKVQVSEDCNWFGSKTTYSTSYWELE